MTQRSSPALPVLVSLIICDQVIDDRLTNKKSAIGLFNAILAATLPARAQQMTVMATLTEVSSRTPLELRLVRDSDNAVLLASQGHVDAPTPLAMIDLVFSMQGVVLPVVGQYAFELLAHGEVLGRRRFQLMMPPKPRPPELASEGPAGSDDDEGGQEDDDAEGELGDQ